MDLLQEACEISTITTERHYLDRNFRQAEVRKQEKNVTMFHEKSCILQIQF